MISPQPRTHPDLVIITPGTTRWALLALPQLLRDLAAAPDPRVDVEVFHACALTLATASPPGRFSPDPPDPAPT